MEFNSAFKGLRLKRRVCCFEWSANSAAVLTHCQQWFCSDVQLTSPLIEFNTHSHVDNYDLHSLTPDSCNKSSLLSVLNTPHFPPHSLHTSPFSSPKCLILIFNTCLLYPFPVVHLNISLLPLV